MANFWLTLGGEMGRRFLKIYFSEAGLGSVMLVNLVGSVE